MAKPKEPPFVAIAHSILESEAYEHLSHIAVRLFLHARYMIFKGRHNTDTYRVTFGYSDMRQWFHNKWTFYETIRELEHYGFLRCVGRVGEKGKGKSVYELSEDWRSRSLDIRRGVFKHFEKRSRDKIKNALD